MIKQLKSDISFLLQFVPALTPDEVKDGLSIMFYVTGSYEGDLKLAKRIDKIRKSYEINESDEIDIEGDFGV